MATRKASRVRTNEPKSPKASRRDELDQLRRSLFEVKPIPDRPHDPMLVPHLAPVERLFPAESKEDPYGLILETICGATDDSQPVEQYDGTLGVTTAYVANHERAVAQVQWNDNLGAVYTNPGNVSGVRWGSGTMVSPDLFLTAGHLFDQTGGGWERPRVNGTSNVISPQEIATNMHLNFNYQVDSTGTPRTEDSFAITQLIEYRLNGVDFSICRIAGSPGNTYGWTTVANVDSAVNDMLCIIGHPAGLRKRIEAGPCSSFSGNQIRYNDIDTLGGNSGSGILQSPTGDLVGVHTNGGCNAAGTGSNFGMRISVVRAASPTLQNLGAATGILADVIATNVVADVGGVLTIPRNDKPVLDDIGTRVLDDVQPTRPWYDKPVWDDVATTFGRDVGPSKRIDDVKAAGYDKQWDDPGFDPRSLWQQGFNRPFVLSTPHHSPVLGLSTAASQAGREDVLGQIEAAIAQTQEMLTQLAARVDALRSEYSARPRNSSQR
jgi:V8-like Glu-specific endopeptidase